MNPMERFTTYFQGSTQIWMITLLLAVFSFLPVFSASTNVYMHMAHITLGLLIAQGAHRVPYRFFGPLSVMMLFHYPGIRYTKLSILTHESSTNFEVGLSYFVGPA